MMLSTRNDTCGSWLTWVLLSRCEAGFRPAWPLPLAKHTTGIVNISTHAILQLSVTGLSLQEHTAAETAPPNMGGHGGLNILPQKRWNGKFRVSYAPWVLSAFSMQSHTASLWWGQTCAAAPAAHTNTPCRPPLPFAPCAVYNRDNRLKVARDEAAHAAEQAEQQEKHRAAEAQARRQLLLERAKQRRAAAVNGHADADAAGSDATDADADADLQQQQLEALQRDARHHSPPHAAHMQLEVSDSRARKRQRVQEGEQQHGLQLQEQPQQVVSTVQDAEQEPVLEHINFWKEFETKAQHPERQVSSSRSSSWVAICCSKG